MGYREIYEDKTDKKIPEDYEVHHIDLDHNNNEIDNLVAIPVELHREYHNCYKTMCSHSIISISYKSFIPQSIQDGNNRHLSLLEYEVDNFVKSLPRMTQTISEITAWINYRDYLLKKMPNIFKLAY